MTSPQSSSRALRFILPSVRDLVFVFLFWSLLAGPLSNRPLADADIGWHIRTGEIILAHHSLPRTDPFSSTMQGQPWFAWEWLYDVLLAALHHICGLNGVVWLCGLVVATTFTLLLSQLMRLGTGLILSVVLTLLSQGAAAIHMFARPHIVSWLFSLLWFVVLELWESCDAGEAGRPPWLWWFFPASMLLWVNLHGGWIFGLALLGIYTLAALIEQFRAHDTFAAVRIGQRAHSMALCWVASALTTLANPFGWHLHAHIYRYLSDSYLMNRIQEFRSPDFHGWAERCFAAILILTLIAFAGNRRANNSRSLRPSQFLVVLLAVYTGFYSSRNLPVSSMLLALISGPILWHNFISLADKPAAWRWLRIAALQFSDFSARMLAQEMRLSGHLWPILAVVFAFAICLHGGRFDEEQFGSRQLIDAKFDPKKMPVEAVTFLQTELQGRANLDPIFSTDAWGGYVIYRMYPAVKVVIDDRHDLYGSGRISQYLILTQGEPGWRQVLETWKIRTVLLPADSTLGSLLRELPQDWSVVHEDKVGVVFEKR